MFNSLRSRLLLTYAVLVGVVLCAFLVFFAWAVQRSPLLYRQTVARLRLAEAAVSARLDILQDRSQENIRRLIALESDSRQMRFVVLSPEYLPLIDTQPGERLPASAILSKSMDSIDPAMIHTFRDSTGAIWLFSTTRLEEGRYLFTAVPRPTLKLRTILRDEFVAPLIRTAAIALGLAALLALRISQWIATPLQRMAGKATSAQAGNIEPMPVEGPQEVRQLGNAINEMIRAVRDGQQSQRDFVANVSHEIKTPLTAIQGFSQAILDGTATSSEDVHQAARVIHDEATRMNRLTLDLLSLARLEAGTADLRRETVNLVALLQSVVDRFQPQSIQHDIQIQTKFGSLPTILGDEDRLAQVFDNLVDNAIKFSPAGGFVKVTAGIQDRSIVIHVLDDGPGVLPEERDRIFERFYQTDKSRRGGSARGVGLGLPIAQEIIRAHGGEIWIQGRAGQGADFVVKLPFGS